MFECSEDDVYKLWRIFNVLAETSDDPEDEEATVPVTVHADEVELLVQRLGAILRTAVTYDAGGSGPFSEFLRTIETTCLAGKNASVVSSAIGQLYDDVIANVLKKVSNSSLYLTLTLVQRDTWCVFFCVFKYLVPSSCQLFWCFNAVA